MSKDYYKTLGVEKSATDAEIKSAYRKLAKQYHPDLNKEEGAEEKFKEIQEAYDVLGDEEKRRQYDQFGSAAFEQGGFGGAGGGYSGFGGFDASGFDFGDIFDNIFGNGFGFGGGGSSNASRPMRGSDRLMRVRLDFDEAVYGCTKDIKVDVTEECDNCSGKGGFGEKTCPTCHGSGTVTQEQRSLFGQFVTKTTCPDCHGRRKSYDKTCTECHGEGRVVKHKTLTITVPKGVDTGSRLRLSGKGDSGANGGENGDLYLEFVVEEHEFYNRDGNDLYLRIPLTISEAILGCKKEIPTIYGNVKVTIPAGTNSGDKQKLKGKGIDNEQKRTKGDLYIIMDVRMPSKLSRDQKRLIDELNDTDLTDNTINKFDRFVANNDR